MKSFDELQKEKVRIVVECIESLQRMSPYLYTFKETGAEEKIRPWAQKYVAVLKSLVKLIEDQEKLCPKGTMCSGRLVEEILSLKGRDGIINHLERVSAGAEEPDVEKVGSVLRVIVSREHSLPYLLKAESELSKAA